MVAEVLFAGGRLDSVDVISGTATETNAASSTTFDAAYSDAAIVVTNAADVFRHFLFTDTGGVLTKTSVVMGETLFAHFSTGGANNSSARGIELRDTSGFPWVRFWKITGALAYVQWNSGTGASPVWTNTAIAYLPPTSVVDFDLTVTLGSPHSVSLYADGSLIGTETFTKSLFTNIAEVHYSAIHRTGHATRYSQLLTTRDISTIGAKVKTIRATGAGAHTEWSGSFANVNEGVDSPTTVQGAISAGLRSTHVMGDVTVPTGFEIKSVFHWLRAKNDGSSPTQIKSVLRSSGVDYSTGNLNYIGLGFGPVGARYDTTPLGSSWTGASWNAIEAGYEAAT